MAQDNNNNDWFPALPTADEAAESWRKKKRPQETPVQMPTPEEAIAAWRKRQGRIPAAQQAAQQLAAPLPSVLQGSRIPIEQLKEFERQRRLEALRQWRLERWRQQGQ